MPVRTCWRDETTGALDPENATRYLAMLRKVQELGGFAHVLFISHNPDAAAQADAQIQDRKSTRLNSSHPSISYAVFGLKKRIKHGEPYRLDAHHRSLYLFVR